MEAREYALMYEMETRHWWFQASRRVLREVARRHWPTPRPGRELRLLDLGCGTGVTLDLFRQERRVRDHGMDVESAALGFCRKRGLRRLVRGSMDAVPFADAAFDVVTALDVIEHVEDDVAALRETARVLRPGGVALITVPAHPWLWSDHDRALHHVRRYRRRELIGRLRDAGLRPLYLSYYNSFLFPAVAAQRLAQGLVRAWRRPDPEPPRSDVRLPPRPVNAALRELFAGERLWLARGRLPMGVSLVTVAVHGVRQENVR